MMKRSSTTGSDSMFSRQTYAKRSKPAFNHLTLILFWLRSPAAGVCRQGRASSLPAARRRHEHTPSM